MGGQPANPDLYRPKEFKHYDKSTDIVDNPPANVPEYQPKTIIPPTGVTEKELFVFPGVNWLEFFRDKVIGAARERLEAAHTAVVDLDVEPGNFDQADSIRTYFGNVKVDTRQNLETFDAVLSNLQTILTSQAKRYKNLNDAVSQTVDGLGTEFRRAAGLVDQVKPLTPSMADPNA